MQQLLNDIKNGESIITSEYDLFSGTSGYLLLLYHTNDYDKLYQCCKKIISDIQYKKTGKFFYTYTSGITGVLWVLNYINNSKEIDYLDEVIDTLNDILINNFTKELKCDLDFLYGFSGIIHYLVDYTDCHYSKAIILEYLELLYLKTFTSQNSLEIKNSFYTDEVLANFGLAHGLPSIIQILSRIYKRNIEIDLSLKLINAYIPFLIANKNRSLGKNGCLFPYTLEASGADSRLAWCYGDLGIAISLWQVGDNIGNEIWKQEADNIFDITLKRKSLIDNMVQDPMVCHGSIGIALIYNRMWKNTGDDKYLEARNYWIDKTKSFKKFNDGIGGYKSFNPTLNQWDNDYSLLNGAIGIALSFISFEDGVNINWDRLLLIS